MERGEVQNVRDLIYYRYAELLARSTFRIQDVVGTESDRAAYVSRIFRDLKSGRWRWSHVLQAGNDLVQHEKKCAFCAALANLHWQPLVPKTFQVIKRCRWCDKIHGIHNEVWCCDACSAAKGNMGLYAFFKSRLPDEPQFVDLIPDFVEKKYLKLAYSCHECAKTLDSNDLDGDGELTVLDIDEVVRRHVP